MHDLKERTATSKLNGINVRKPTGKVPWPLILLEGEEKVGKSWSCAELSASDKVGDTYWIDLGEGASDEYGAIPGARYMVIEHDGTWSTIMDAVIAVRDEAQRAAEAGERPTVLVIDSMSAEWELLKDWAASTARARMQKKGRVVPADAEVKISMDLWNDANSRHRRLMTLLMTFPGIVVMTARGKEVAAMDDAGKPIQGVKEYKVEGQKTLGFDASVWVRMSRDHGPLVTGMRSVHAKVRPGIDKPEPLKGFTLESLIFDLLRCDPGTAQVRALAPLDGDETVTAVQYRDKVLTSTDMDELKAWWIEAKTAELIDDVIVNELGDEETLKEFFTRKVTELKAEEA